jgi:Flp pilus assembly protein TadD
MMKRTMIFLLLTLTLILSVSQLVFVQAVLMTPTERALLERNDTPSNEMKENTGNGFVRALKAPFKAIGRLFGKGKKDENKLQRLTEKDLKNFETTPADPIRNATIPKSNFAESNHLAQGRLYLDAGSVNEAIGELTRAASTNPTLAEAHNLLGLAYERKGLRNRALNSFAMAVGADQKNHEYLNNFGYLLFRNGDYKKAAKFLQRAAKLAPDNARAWNNLGLAQCELGNFADAYKSFAQALGEYRGHLNIAARLQSVGQSNEAIKHLEKALILQPTSISVLERLAGLYESAGKQTQAQSVRNSLLALRGSAPAVDQ